MTSQNLHADALAAEELEPRTLLRIASERLSTVRYVFVVAIEDGIANVTQRSALEYSDAVLLGWPDMDAPDVRDAEAPNEVADFLVELEKRIDVFRAAERENDVETMADTLIRISEYVARVRKAYQPKFLLPTYAEIRRYVQQQWEEEMQEPAESGEGA
ncbi:hypothetical protein B9G54_05805 [Alloscardovia macacae]|uniref:Phosphoribosylglycinamide synthetase n=1 Tax=Alloscardovia macacae TaxID=1160091 RepID=A0A1Y2STZ0_9BIFI|nr:hypothetical protein [Alloscardovia macacae]OTA26196.1 hypothetical protein B9G54_05805 [Alloscardovia macacae]OTA29953.1 hypothetical protein B9T39_00885 [Alloscardovia macacae]